MTTAHTVDVTIAGTDDFPDGGQCLVDVKFVHLLRILRGQGFHESAQALV